MESWYRKQKVTYVFIKSICSKFFLHPETVAFINKIFIKKSDFLIARLHSFYRTVPNSL